jgi:carbonic anhydrase/acetyltransferase-like protein (isoleucine patch superfamily)
MNYPILSRSIALQLSAFALALLIPFAAYAQTTAFTYQGRLTDGAGPANAIYDMQFKLFDAVSAGSQIGATITNGSVQVTNGIFTVQLNGGGEFGSTAFPGADRYLEISVRLAGSSGAYSVLAPRQKITSTPYAVQALNALTANNLTTTGGANFIQNTTAQQSNSNFNITGNGTAAGTFSGNVVNTMTQYNIGGSRVFSIPGFNNLFVGLNAGNANTTGSENTFVGRDAGRQNTTGFSNAFVGENAGLSNTTGNNNSFFGTLAGFSDTTSGNNSFFGSSAGQNVATGSGNNSFFGFQAGQSNTIGAYNSFVGAQAGISNTSGIENSYLGTGAGTLTTTGSFNSYFGGTAGTGNTTGSRNTFIGYGSGNQNTIGSDNTVIGFGADLYYRDLSHATVIGSDAVVSTSNSVVLGRDLDTVRIPGNLIVTGSVSKGSGSFRIDHPLDPANKYLYHSFVESPDMMNVYNGNAVMNENGEATITLPDYFEALNRDFRYQLTTIGGYAPVYVAEEVRNNSFKIAGGKPGIKVSWQVTGIRHDKYADDERIKTEVNKPEGERGQCAYAPACSGVKP